MENPNPDDTQPAGTSSESDPADTRPLTIDEGNPEDPEFAQTVRTPTAIVPAGQPEAGETLKFSPQELDEQADLGATVPTSPARPPEIPPPASPELGAISPSRKPSMRLVILLGLLVLIAIAAFSAYAGYNNGIGQRKQAEASLVVGTVKEQFDLGVQDMQNKNFDLARQRFQYVIQIDPNYPGVTEKLANVLVELNTTATPTVSFTATPSPTPDTRGVQELFTQAQQFLANSDWNQAIATLLSLRKADPKYQPVWVDDMLYVAFRNRGKDKILKSCDLEGGIYDLAQAKQFGPLDYDSNNYLTWAGIYLTGASFWDLDWSQAVYYFAQVAPALPNLCDGSKLTAAERYRLALAGYGDQLAKNGDWCGAKDQYAAALNMGNDSQVEESYKNAVDACEGNTQQSQPTQNVQPTASGIPPTSVGPTATSAPPADTPTPVPPTAVPPTEAPPPTQAPTPNPTP